MSLAEAYLGRPATRVAEPPPKAPPAPSGGSHEDSLLITDLIRDEGLRLKTYYDTAKPPRRTIGIGHNIDADTRTPPSVIQQWLTLGMTPAEAHDVCLLDIAEVKRGLDAKLPWWRTLDPVRQDALKNMCFNLGLTTLLTFTNTLRFMQAKDWVNTVAHLRASKWHGQVKGRADRIEHMFLTGQRL
jgi:lysozyme